MADFDVAIRHVLKWEGGYSNNSKDPGGETNYGISKKSYPDVDIKHLTLEEAKQIYKRDYWKFGGINDQPLATKALDFSVNLGASVAIRTLQKALNAQGAGLAEDGRFGPMTCKACNTYPVLTTLNLLIDMVVERYISLVLSNPSLKTFLNGWLNRAKSLP